MLRCLDVDSRTEPVSLEALKQLLRLDGDHEDALLKNLLALSRQAIEQMLDMSLVFRKWELTAHRPHRKSSGNNRLYLLPRGPVVSLEDAFFETDEAKHQVPRSFYKLWQSQGQSFVLLTSFPGRRAWIKVVYTAGFKCRDEMPTVLAQAILLMAADFYKKNTVPAFDDAVDGGCVFSPSVMQLLALYRSKRLV